MTVLPNDQLTVRVGCKLTYEAARETTLLLAVQPHIDLGQTLLAESLLLGAGLAAEPLRNQHGVRVLRLKLPPGRTEIVHDALVSVPPVYDLDGVRLTAAVAPEQLSGDLLRYIQPSRFCESDRLGTFAWQTFGSFAPGWPRVQAVTGWIRREIGYRLGPEQAEQSAWDLFQRRHGGDRGLAHLAIALFRALNLPARYATGHLPDIGCLDPGMDKGFHAYAEVYLGGLWFPIEARGSEPRLGRIKISHGCDAVDCAVGTTFGPVTLSLFEVWAYQVEAGTVTVGDPIDLAKRLDGGLEVRVKLNA